MPTLIEDAELATREQWEGIGDLVRSQLLKSQHHSASIAVKNIDKLKPWKGVGICIFREMCKMMNSERPPEPSTFRSFITAINQVLEGVPPPLEGKRFVLLYYAYLPQLLKKTFDAAASHNETQSDGSTLTKTRITESAAFCCLCVGTPGPSTSVAVGIPVLKTLPIQQTRNPIDCLKKVTDKKCIEVGSTQWEPLIGYKLGRAGQQVASGLYAKLLSDMVKLETDDSLTVDFKPLSPNQAVEKLNSGDVQCAVGFAETANRVSQGFMFVGLMHLIHFVGVVRAEARAPSSFRDFAKGKIIVRTESGGHDVVRQLLGIPKDQVTANGSFDPDAVLTDLSVSRFDVGAISDGITFLRYVPNLRTKSKLKALSPSCAVLRMGFMVRDDQREFAEWLVERAERVLAKQSFRDEEDKTLKPFEQYVQRCWARNV